MREAWLRLAGAGVLLVGLAGAGRIPAPTDGGGTRACDAEGPWEEAMLVNCLSLQPRNVEWLMELGAHYERTARWVDAERVYRRAADVDGRDADVQLRLSRALTHLGDRDRAVAALARAAALRPGADLALAAAVKAP